jgi:hypothetical protein
MVTLLLSNLFCAVRTFQLLNFERTKQFGDSFFSSIISYVFESFMQKPVQLCLLLLFSFSVIIQLLSLSSDVWSVSVNEMFHEDFRFRVVGRRSNAKNPYDRGFVGNWKEVLFPPFP